MFRNVTRCCAFLLCLAGMSAATDALSLWLDVPFVKQERNGCGAASIAMVMQYWQRQQGKPADTISDAREIQRALYSKSARGIYASEVESYLRRYGFRTFAFQGAWGDLQVHLQKGRPLIVALRPGSSSALHYVVVTGLDSAQKLVFVNDPAERKLLRRDQRDFERQWRGAGNWTLLAVPEEGEASASAGQ